jgi:hypothetical protein
VAHRSSAAPLFLFKHCRQEAFVAPEGLRFKIGKVSPSFQLVCNYKKNYILWMRFEWDAAKSRSNFAKHGLDFADAELVFAGPCVTFIE